MSRTRPALALFTALLPALVGCSSGSGFTFFEPTRHPLLPLADAFRQPVPQPAPVPRELAKTPIPEYLVEPGDVLLVQPSDLDSPVRLPGDQPVLPDGTIDLGRYGRLSVAGKSVPQIEAEVRAAVVAQEQGKEKEVGFIDVRLVNRQSKVFYVLGEVNAPGSFPLAGRETVLDAVVAAGGLNDRASPDRIILSRPTVPDGCRVVLPVCYRNIVQLGDTTTNYQIQPGDRVFVPSKTFCENLAPLKQKANCSVCDGPQRPCSLGEPQAGCDPAGR